MPNSKKQTKNMKRNNPLLAKMMRNAGASTKQINSFDLALYTNLRDSEQYASALQLINEYLLHTPNNAQAHAHLAHIYMLNNMEEPALEALKKAIALEPQHLATLQNHARWLIRKNYLSQALGLINQALTLDPNHIETHELKAHALLSLNDLPTALVQINFVLSLQENRLSALALRCSIHLRTGNSQAAINDGIFVVRQKPHWADTWVLVVSAYHHLNLNNEALNAVKEGLKYSPHHLVLKSLLGEFLVKTQQHREAIDVLKKIIEVIPNSIASWLHLGFAFENTSQFDEAEKAYLQVISFDPNQLNALQNLGVLSFKKKEYELAVSYYKRALIQSPDNIELYLNNGLALICLSDRENEIREIIKKLFNIAPNLYVGHYLNALLQNKLKRFSDAARAAEQASILAPGHTGLLLFHAALLKELGYANESEKKQELAWRSNKNDLNALSNLIFQKTYNGAHAPNHILETASIYSDAISNQTIDYHHHLLLTKQTGQHPQKLKVGFISGDFRNHPVGYFICSIFEAMDTSKIELHLYTNNTVVDELTARLRANCSTWTDISTKDDHEVKNLIETGEIHILVDLSGHTLFHRLPLFAKKPAPIQATWLGFLATTGLTEIDWLIGDRFVTPVEDESHFSEKIWRMPECYACFTAPENVPEVNELPALSNSFITFGSFNNLMKITDEVVRVWSRLLLSVPNSRLFLKYSQFDFSEAIQTTQARFAKYGITPERLIIEGSSLRSEHLASFQRVDITLDPFPYGGGTTNYESLYMGVPILTINGDRFLSRVGTCVMHFVGHPEFSAKDENDFIQKGIALTSDLSKLAETRRHLREKGLASSLFNANRFAAQLEQAFFDMWQHHLNKLGNPI
jgi:predicted O-linked N-acetylglucosamine transferase (SPINDLY family)/antitoxin component HigA of HigAB toxin-antitoxin module